MNCQENISYLSPSLSLVNWSTIIHKNVIPILALPKYGVSAMPPTNKSILSESGKSNIHRWNNNAKIGLPLYMFYSF